jgi:hypothetical protein
MNKAAVRKTPSNRVDGLKDQPKKLNLKTLALVRIPITLAIMLIKCKIIMNSRRDLIQDNLVVLNQVSKVKGREVKRKEDLQG